MTRQEMFDRAARGVIAQGAPSYDETQGGCLYRGPNNCRCNVGHLIPDDKYRPDMEGYTACAILDRAGIAPLLGSLLGVGTFLESMQACHDEAAFRYDGGPTFIADYRKRMRAFASEWRLSPAVLDESPPTTSTEAA